MVVTELCCMSCITSFITIVQTLFNTIEIHLDLYSCQDKSQSNAEYIHGSEDIIHARVYLVIINQTDICLVQMSYVLIYSNNMLSSGESRHVQ